MEIFYRGHRVAIGDAKFVGQTLRLQIVGYDGLPYTAAEIVLPIDVDTAYELAVEHGLQAIDDSCDGRLAFPEDEIQPSY